MREIFNEWNSDLRKLSNFPFWTLYICQNWFLVEWQKNHWIFSLWLTYLELCLNPNGCGSDERLWECETFDILLASCKLKVFRIFQHSRHTSRLVEFFSRHCTVWKWKNFTLTDFRQKIPWNQLFHESTIHTVWIANGFQ